MEHGRIRVGMIIVMQHDLKSAVDFYKDKSQWNRLMINAMGEDFSWSHSAREYVELYRKAINKRTKT